MSDEPLRINSEDLPPIEDLTEEEAASVFGAGRARLGLEALETRDLMAGNLTASLSGAVLRVEGTANADHIRILHEANQISVVNVQTGGAVGNFSVSGVQRIAIDALAGDDQVWVNYDSGTLTPALEVAGSGGRDVLHTNAAAYAAGSGDGVVKTARHGGAVYTLLQDGTLQLNGQNHRANTADFALAGPNATVYALNTAHEVWSYDGSWSRISGNDVRALAAGPNGSVYVLNTANEIYRLDGGWTRVSGNDVRSMVAGSEGCTL